MIKAQLLNKGSYSKRLVALKTFIESYRHQTKAVTCWTLLQKENVKYKFLICRVEVYPKVHEAVNKTSCYIVKSVKVTLSDLLCSFFSCLCWCNLRGKERKNIKKKVCIGMTLLSYWRRLPTCFTLAQWSYSIVGGHGPAPVAAHGLLCHTFLGEFIFDWNIKADYIVLHSCVIWFISENSNYHVIQNSIKPD